MSDAVQIPLLRSQLYVPGTNPSMLQNAPWMGADAVILDLEDAVSEDQKDAARDLVAETLKSVNFRNVKKIVRINGTDTPFFKDDLDAVIPQAPDAIRVPKIESPEELREINEIIRKIEKACGLEEGKIKIHAMLETAAAVLESSRIARACSRLTAISLGGQDLAADMGIQRTQTGEEMFVAKGLVVLAARASRIMVFSTPYTNLNDSEGLLRESRMDMQLGFSGKAAIHPSQCRVIHQAFTPTIKEIRKAKEVAEAFYEAVRKGSGVIKVRGNMVDKPVVEQSFSILHRAKAAGINIEEVER